MGAASGAFAVEVSAVEGGVPPGVDSLGEEDIRTHDSMGLSAPCGGVKPRQMRT